MESDRDEDGRIAELVALNLAATPGGSGPVPRGQHPKHHGCVEARFEVRDDVPVELRNGVFAQPQAFSALIRFSNGRTQDDRRADAHGMAIKLLDVPGAKLLAGREDETAQDFVLVDSETFFTGDPADYSRVNRAIMGKGWPRVWAWIGLLLRPALLMRIRDFTSKRPLSPLEGAYFSTVPFALGDRVVKYAVLPRDLPSASALTGPDGLSAALRDRLAEASVRFTFCVDIQSDPHAHPIEDPTVSWSKASAKRIALAELILAPQKIEPDAPLAENLQFSPWHALPVHAPLGYINQARGPIYRELAKARHARRHIRPLESSEAPASYASGEP